MPKLRFSIYPFSLYPIFPSRSQLSASYLSFPFSAWSLSESCRRTKAENCHWVGANQNMAGELEHERWIKIENVTGEVTQEVSGDRRGEMRGDLSQERWHERTVDGGDMRGDMRGELKGELTWKCDIRGELRQKRSLERWVEKGQKSNLL